LIYLLVSNSITTGLTDRTTWLSGRLYVNSPTFARPYASVTDYSYESIEIVVYTPGNYQLKSNSSMHTYGCLYSTSFDSLDPYSNLITCDDGGQHNNQFEITSQLESSVVYILVVTTFNGYIFGNYSVSAIGPQSISMQTYKIVESKYNGYLSSNELTFVRPNSFSDGSYYFNEIELTVNENDRYTIKSRSSLVTYGCLYDGSFDPSNPSDNLIICNDYSGKMNQFLIEYPLVEGQNYILVVTTVSPYMSGSYSVIITGSSLVDIRLITPTDNSLSTIAILLITIGVCLLFTSIVLAILFCKRKFQHDPNNLLIVSPRRYSYSNVISVKPVLVNVS